MPNRTPARILFSQKLDAVFIEIYKAWRFVLRFFKELFTARFNWREFMNQCYTIGVQSLFLITVTGIITGVVFTLQFRPIMREFGATSWIPATVAVAIVRALAPLVTSIICAGKIGSGLGAALGAMRVTDQIDAMEVSAVNPYHYLVVNRVLATAFTLPLLTVYFGLLSALGSFINVHQADNASLTSFVYRFFSKIDFIDYFSAIFRTAVYGFTIGMVGCYQGFNTRQGTEGVGRAANRAVVVTIFILFFEEVTIVSAINFIRTL